MCDIVKHVEQKNIIERVGRKNVSHTVTASVFHSVSIKLDKEDTQFLISPSGVKDQYIVVYESDYESIERVTKNELMKRFPIVKKFLKELK